MKQLEDKKRQADTIIKNQIAELERLQRDLTGKVKECDDMRSRLSKQDQQLSDLKQADVKAKELDKRYSLLQKDQERLNGILRAKQQDAEQLKAQCQ